MQTITASSLLTGEGQHRLANFEQELDYVVNNLPEGRHMQVCLQSTRRLEFKGKLTTYQQINFQDVRKRAGLSREENELIRTAASRFNHQTDFWNLFHCFAKAFLKICIVMRRESNISIQSDDPRYERVTHITAKMQICLRKMETSFIRPYHVQHIRNKVTSVTVLLLWKTGTSDFG